MKKSVQSVRDKIEKSGLLESIDNTGIDKAEKIYSEWLDSIAPDGCSDQRSRRILEIAVAAHCDATLRSQLTGARRGPPTKWTSEIRSGAIADLNRIIDEQGLSKADAARQLARRQPYRQLIDGSSNPGAALLRQIQEGQKQERTLRAIGSRVSHFFLSRLKKRSGFRKWLFGSKKQNNEYGDW